MEPLFGILAVYDMAKKKRLSENFYFELNSGRTEKMINRVRNIWLFIHFANGLTVFPSHQGNLNYFTPQKVATKAAIFDISDASTDIYLLLRIEKVLQGDIEACTDPYIKHDTVISHFWHKATWPYSHSCM